MFQRIFLLQLVVNLVFANLSVMVILYDDLCVLDSAWNLEFMVDHSASLFFCESMNFCCPKFWFFSSAERKIMDTNCTQYTI